MCELRDKLIAWLDQELPVHEAAELEGHVRSCVECRSCLASYKQTSEAIEEYCEANLESPAPRAFLRWTAVIFATAAAITFFFVFPHAGVRRDAAQTQVATATTAVAPEPPTKTTSTPMSIHKPVPKRRVAAPAQVQNATWIPSAPAIQIAIPAESMFAPGAVPQGMSFSADLTIAADGSAQQLRLRP